MRLRRLGPALLPLALAACNPTADVGAAPSPHQIPSTAVIIDKSVVEAGNTLTLWLEQPSPATINTCWHLTETQPDGAESSISACGSRSTASASRLFDAIVGISGCDHVSAVSVRRPGDAEGETFKAILGIFLVPTTSSLSTSDRLSIACGEAADAGPYADVRVA
ncbi:hypothetical protein [Hamadaea tsunoensis]|uniref:hypothetical protein n=1 Tax=Hamadaea tsunoensis TaxID=53368 RepID=UPI0003F50426|nr:hypothetical protein [Hamadaea tsunoensis]